MTLRTRLYARRATQWCGSVFGVFGAVGSSVGGLTRNVYRAYFARKAVKGKTTKEKKATAGFWDRWSVRLGFRRRVVVRRKRNAQHLHNLEGELEDLKKQLAGMNDLLAPASAPQSSSGCPTTSSPATAAAAPAAAAASSLPPKRRPPPPPRRGAGGGACRGAAEPSKVRLRASRAPTTEEVPSF
eukprot:Rhum_TRINITY_DN12126_c0_g1::Rhum_TRINITY_DN12126_c0_g1_i1::g.49366::m.49366